MRMRSAPVPKGVGLGPVTACCGLASEPTNRRFLVLGLQYAVDRGSSGPWRFVGPEPGAGQRNIEGRPFGVDFDRRSLRSDCAKGPLRGTPLAPRTASLTASSLC